MDMQVPSRELHHHGSQHHSPRLTKKRVGVSIIGLSILVGVGLIWRLLATPTPVALTLDEQDFNLEFQTAAGDQASDTALAAAPFARGVAGVDVQAGRESGSEFGLIGDETCQIGQVFSIGEPEASPLDNPVNELSWVGALDVVPDYTNPFVVGQSVNTDFPWRTHSNQADTLETEVVFNYQGSRATAKLQFGWSPGKFGTKQKEVLLNSVLVGATPERQGEFAGGWWENFPRYEESLPLILSPGEHKLTFRHRQLSETGDAALWDYIRLMVTECH
jgi:hypothetical protein